jgi:hypothetical protein
MRIATSMEKLDDPTCSYFDSSDSRRDEGEPALWDEAPLFSEKTLRLNGRRVETVVSTAAAYIYSRICDASSDLLKASIPYRYIRGKNHGKIEGKFQRWDMRIEAGGKEGVVDELQRRIWDYERRRFEILTNRWEAASRSCVYIVSNSGSSRGSVHVVFSDKNAMRLLRLGDFVRNWCSIARPGGLLRDSIDAENRLLADFIAQEHGKVLLTYEPKVTRIPGRYRMLAAGRRKGF